MIYGDNNTTQLSSSNVISNPKEWWHSYVRRIERENSKYNNEQRSNRSKALSQGGLGSSTVLQGQLRAGFGGALISYLPPGPLQSMGTETAYSDGTGK